MLHKTKKQENKRKILVGSAASPGYVFANAKIAERRSATVSAYKIDVKAIAINLEYFRKSMLQAINEITKLKDIAIQKVGLEKARIFDSHLMMLQDPAISKRVQELIRKEHYNAGYAFHLTLQEIITNFENHKNKLMRERAYDIKDLYNRVIMILTGGGKYEVALDSGDENFVLVGHSIDSETLMHSDKNKVLGIALDVGGVTSHISILARSLQIPAVMGLSNLSEIIENGCPIIIDGTSGIVIIYPNEIDIAKCKKQVDLLDKQKFQLFAMRPLEPITMDGKYIKLNANIELYVEMGEVLNSGATGVGLYRSEFLYFEQNKLPTCEEQYKIYSELTHKLYPMPVTIRTLDAGGDKMVFAVASETEANPFMGWRSIRICLDKKDMFKEQLRALILAGDKGNLKIMFPMITNVSEFEKAKFLYNECCEELRREGIEVPNIELGIMIEVPSAVIMIDELASRADFLSIGTNDLIQFTLAVDRSNGKISHLYEPHNPAILRMIKQVVNAAHKVGIPVSVCGEMAADPLSAILLVGLGVDELSVASCHIMECKKIIRSINYDDVRAVADEVMKMSDTESVNYYLKNKYFKKIKELGIPSFITSMEFSFNIRALVKVDGKIENVKF